MRRISLISVKCQRCGKTLVATDRSLYRLDDLKRAVGVLCSDCATEEEKQELNHEIGKQLAGVK